MKKIIFSFILFFTVSCNSNAEVSMPNNFVLTLDRQYVFEENDDLLITDITKFDLNSNGTISIISSKDGSCKLYDTTGNLLWHYLPDWKLIDTFLTVLQEGHDMLIRKDERDCEIFDSKRLIERQWELHGEINEDSWLQFLKSYKHSVEGFCFDQINNHYYLIIKIQISAKEIVNNKVSYFQAYQPLIIQSNGDFAILDYIPIINYYIDSLKYTKLSSDLLTSYGFDENLSIYMNVSASFHPRYSKEDPKTIKFYTIAEIDRSSNEKSYGAILPDKNIEYKVFDYLSLPLMSVDKSNELWYVFPINDTLYNYHTNKRIPLQFEVNNDEFYHKFADDSDYLTKAQRLNFMVDKISITQSNDILVNTFFPRRDGNKHSATSLVQVYAKDGNLKRHFRYNIGYFQNHQVHGIAANPYNEDEVIVISGDEENYYINYYKWSKVK